MKLFANIISCLFNPLLMVTYGMILALTFTYLAVYPPMMKLWLTAGVFLSTAVIPGLFIGLMIKKGAASDMELTNRSERSIPYLIFISSILICTFYLHKIMLPFWFISLLLGACIVLIAALIINFFWKISAHMLGIGGLLGGIMGISRLNMINPYWAFIIIFIIAGLLGTSRIFLQKHTPMQVYVGFCLGFAGTFSVSFMNDFFLFIR